MSLAACEAIVRRHDPDRFFSALFAPADRRPFLFALYAFNHELAHIGEVAREPMIAEIRLAWWRETVEGARAGKPRNHDVARALAETFAANDLPQAPFDAMIDARAFDASPGLFADLTALETYADATSGNLMRLAAHVLGGGNDDLARDAGIAYAIAGLIRSMPHHAARGRQYLSNDVLAEARVSAGRHLLAARKRKPGSALPAYLPAALVRLYLKQADPPLYRKQISLLAAATRGRI